MVRLLANLAVATFFWAAFVANGLTIAEVVVTTAAVVALGWEVSRLNGLIVAAKQAMNQAQIAERNAISMRRQLELELNGILNQIKTMINQLTAQRERVPNAKKRVKDAEGRVRAAEHDLRRCQDN